MAQELPEGTVTVLFTNFEDLHRLDDQWTLSVQHSDEDVEAHLAVFEAFAHDVMAA